MAPMTWFIDRTAMWDTTISTESGKRIFVPAKYAAPLIIITYCADINYFCLHRRQVSENKGLRKNISTQGRWISDVCMILYKEAPNDLCITSSRKDH
jgi:hypothetical protein